MKHSQVVLYHETSDGDEAIVLPSKFELCEACGGSGVTTRHIEPDGGGFTASEWQEALSDDPDFAENYCSGAYDRPCPECDGLRVISVVDESSCDPDLLAEYERQQYSMLCDRRVQESERRMGA